jgi:hypothetical protein
MRTTLILILIVVLYEVNSQKIEGLDSHGSLWIKTGVVFTTGSYAHLHIPYKLESLDRRAKFLKALNARFQLLTIPKEWPTTQRRNIQRRLQYVQQFINITTFDTISRLNEVMTATHDKFTIPHHYTYNEEKNIRTQPRRKRQLIAALTIGLGAAAGAIAGQFSEDTMEKIVSRNQEVLSKTIEDNLIRLHNNEADLRILNQTVSALSDELEKEFLGRERLEFENVILRTSFAASTVSLEMTRVVHSISQARHGRLDPESIDATGLKKALEALNKMAVHHGFELATQHPSDLASLPTSYFLNVDQKTIHLISHIPLFRPDSNLELYRYLDAPLMTTLKPDVGPIYLEVTPPSNFLALAKDATTYIPMDEADLESCQKKGTEYFCPLLTRYKRERPNCLMALFENDHEAVRKMCPVALSNSVSKAERIDNHRWLVTEAIEQDLRITCPNGKLKRKRISGSTIVELEPGCSANTASITITRPYFEADIVVQGILNNTLITPSLWINEEDRPHIEAITRQLLGQVGNRAPLNQIRALTEFRRQLQTIQLTSWTFDWKRWIFHGLVPSVTSVILLVLACFMIKWTWPTISKWISKTCRKGPPSTPHHEEVPPDRNLGNATQDDDTKMQSPADRQYLWKANDKR